jgi:formylglycine-generating enzyme required for sulfatase activity
MTFDPRQSAGLFVGVREFKDPTIPLVAYAADDAVDLAHLFTLELGLLDPKKVVLAISGEPQKPESRQRLAELRERGADRIPATNDQIYQRAYELGRETGEQGLYVVTLASHGLADQGQVVLLPENSWGQRPVHTGIHLLTLMDDVERAIAPRRLLIADCCRARRQSPVRDFQETEEERQEAMQLSRRLCEELAARRGMASLSGTTHGGLTYDDHKAKNGVFTGALLAGLRGAAAVAGKPFITLGDLAAYADQRVSTWIQANHPKDQRSLGILLTPAPEEMRHLPLAENKPDAFLAPMLDPWIQNLVRPVRAHLVASKPSWAQEFGNDPCGTWADLALGTGTMRFRLVPAGGFTMGSPASESKRSKNEGPQHKVVLSRPFWLTETTVTQKQLSLLLPLNRSIFSFGRSSETLPAVNVSWEEAQSFVQRLNMLQGFSARASLPTEAQWEYACRAGADSLPEGKLDDVAWYAANSAGKLQPVARLRRNAWGFFDLLGNVCEWCADAFAPYPAEPRQDPHTQTGDSRVVRGGCYLDGPDRVRPAARSGLSPVTGYDFVGFRVALWE